MEEGQQQQQQQQQQQEAEVLARLPVGLAAHTKAEQGVLVVHRSLSHLVRLDADWLRHDFKGFVLEVQYKKDEVAQTLLGGSDMAADGEAADKFVGLLRMFFAGPGGLRAVDADTRNAMEEMLAMLRRRVQSQHPAMCQESERHGLACLMAKQHMQLEAAATRSAALAAVRAQLDGYVDVLIATEGMVLPVLYMTVILDATLAHLVARHLQGVYDKMLANNKCSPQAAAAVNALVEATGLGRSDALCLLSEPGFASRAAEMVLDSDLALGPEAQAFWQKLLSSWGEGEDGKHVVTDSVYAWTPEQLRFVVELVTSCFATLTDLVEGARQEECCGPFYNTMVLTCAVGYNPVLVNTIFVYGTIGLEDSLDLLSLVAMHEGLRSEVAIWAAAKVERHCAVATLFDTQFGATMRKGCNVQVLMADHLNRTCERMGAVEGQQAALQQQLDAQGQAAAAMQQQLDAQGQQAAAAQQATDQRLDNLQELLLMAVGNLLEQKPITPRRAAKLQAAVGAIPTSSRTVGVEPIPFGSRVASPEPEEQQPESSAAASRRAAAEPPAAPEASAAGSSRAAAAAPTAAAAAAVVAAPAAEPAVAALRGASSGGGSSRAGAAASRPAGAASGSQTEHSIQAAGRSQGFGVGRHTALRAGEHGAARTARQVQRAAEQQAERDRTTYANDSGLRQRQMSSSEGRNRTAPVASAAYGRAVRRWV